MSTNYNTQESRNVASTYQLATMLVWPEPRRFDPMTLYAACLIRTAASEV